MGAPTSLSTSLYLSISGSGFLHPLTLPGGVCEFTLQTNASVKASRPLQVLSPTSARCLAPSVGVLGTYDLSVMQNGVTPDPPLNGQLTFREYDLASVNVTMLEPRGGPLGIEMALTVHGSGFVNLGVQPACRLGSSTIVVGTLLDESRILCTVPANFTATALYTAVSVSLNGGTNGTFSANAAIFVYYAPPRLDSISPNSGNATGGTLVTLTGAGFDGLDPSDPARRAEHLRCRFGFEAQPTAAISHTATSIVCTTSWGVETQTGLPVSLSLNANSYALDPASGGGPANGRRALRVLASNDNNVVFYFQGGHAPAVVETYFNQAGTTLVIQFDSQATDRAGMQGLELCSRILDSVTVTQLQGSDPSAPLCAWLDDSTVYSQLTAGTDAAPGITVRVRAGTVCAAKSSDLCVADTLVAVDKDFPCDRAGTPDRRELCGQPEVVIQAPTELSSCPGTSATLDASLSLGGGVKPLVFVWRAVPATCDNFYAITSRIEKLGSSAARLSLRAAELDEGNEFVIMLVWSHRGSHTVPHSLPMPTAICSHAHPVRAASQNSCELCACFLPDGHKLYGTDISNQDCNYF